jgi:alpha-L-rhamnosidase
MTVLQSLDLRCEHLFEPQGLNTRQPRFSWALEGAGHDRRQTAYQIVVGSRRDRVAVGHGDHWDSGKVLSTETLLVPYEGSVLASDETLFWTVRVWDESDREGQFCPPAMLRTGLMDPRDWHAHWIARALVPPGGRMPPQDTVYDNPYSLRPPDCFRREFPVSRTVRRATAYVSALGLYELRINGDRIGDQVLAPGWTDYHTRVEYQSYDVTDRVRLGANVIAAVVAEGWYSGRVAYDNKRAGSHYGVRPALLCQLHIEYEDGAIDRLATDASWKCGQEAIVYSDLLLGEKYDARLETPGWDKAGFDDAAWWNGQEIMPTPRPPRLDATRGVPTRKVIERKATFLHETVFGTFIFDTGQNLAGHIRMEADGQSGDTFVLRHGEALQLDGTLYTANLRWALATDTFVAKGGRQVFEPRFTVHGFRYVELAAPRGVRPQEITLTAIAVHSDMPSVGTFECGNELVNQLQSNIVWTQRSNFLSVPTDCPQRDERMGWLGDAQVFFNTATCNMDGAAFFTKWLVDVADAQTIDGAFTDVAPSLVYTRFAPEPPRGAPGWGDGGVIMPWRMYERYGDADLLRTHYAGMKRWMDLIERNNSGFVRNDAVFSNWGDWLALGKLTPKNVVATAYWAELARIMEKTARVLGERQDLARFTALARDIRMAFRNAYVDDQMRISGDTQTGYLFALAFDLIGPEGRPKIRQHLLRSIADANGHIQTGIHGIRYICSVLCDEGDQETAFDLLLKETYPSWGFSIRNGATTIWERWDGWTPERGFQSVNMNSLNHYALGSIGEWLYARVAGIDTSADAPAYSRIRVRPLPCRKLKWCKASLRSHRGLISSEWRFSGDSVTWTLKIPPNCVAEIELPLGFNRVEFEGREHMRIEPDGFDNRTFELGSGTYEMTLHDVSGKRSSSHLATSDS